MADARVRMLREENLLTVKILMAHEMESGQRKDEAGQRIPAWFIAQLAVWIDDECVLQADWGPAVAKNPYLQFTLENVAAGGNLHIAWRDNLGIEHVEHAPIP